MPPRIPICAALLLGAAFCTNVPTASAVDATTTATVTLRSDLYAGLGAHVRIGLNSVQLAEFTVGSSWRTFSVTLPRPVRANDDLEVFYDNDTAGLVGGTYEDRNLHVSALSFGGRRYAVASGTFDAGSTWQSATDGIGVRKASMQLTSNGALRVRATRTPRAGAVKSGNPSAGTSSAVDATSRRPAVGAATVQLDSFSSDGTAQGNAQQFQAALDALQQRGGGTLVVPDRRITLQPDGVLAIPAHVAVVGSGARSELALHAASTDTYQQLFRISQDDVRIENLKLTRDNAAYGRMITIAGGTGIWMSGVTIDTNATSWGNDFSAVDLVNSGASEVHQLTLTGCTFNDTQYGLVSSSNRTGLVEDVLVTGSRFVGNHSDDLGFNSPAGVMRNVRVVGNSFSDNQSSTPWAGFGVGVANVDTGEIRDNAFSGYPMNPVHLEDRSKNWSVVGNTFTAGSTKDTGYAADVIVLSGTSGVSISNNRFDTAQQSNRISAVLVTAGSPTATAPSDVKLNANQYRLANGSVELTDSGESVTADPAPVMLA